MNVRDRRSNRSSRSVGAVLLAVFALGLVVTALDPRAADRSPGHDHVVVGAHTLQEWARALALHHGDGQDWEGRSPAAQRGPAGGGAPRSTPHVISLSRSVGACASVFDIDSLPLAGLTHPAIFLRAAGGQRLPAPRKHLLFPIPPAPLEPPPRTFS